VKNYRTNLILILVLVVWVIYALVPNTPGIKLGFFNRDLKTRLGLDLTGGLSALLEVDLPAGTQLDTNALSDTIKILESRSNALGVSEVIFQQAGPNRIVAEFPGLTNTQDVVSALKQVGQLAFVPLGSEYLDPGTKIQIDYTKVGAMEQPPLQPTPTPGEQSSTTGPQPTAQPVERVYSPLMTGSALDSVIVGRDQLGAYTIDFTLKSDAAKLFGDYTSGHVGDYLAIVLDGTVLSSPRVNSAITEGRGQISGNFTQESANQLAIQLRYGSLPVPLKISESRQVGATLGEDSVRRSVIAGSIGLALVILFMVIYYRLPGMVAGVALGFYAALTMSLFKLIPVVLTLPGIAGFVLSIGMAVDANILIFSRMREELRSGRNLRQAIDLAWKRAWPSIRDSNISTLITCLILFWFGNAYGATIVKGFAFTLMLGVLVSMFTAIVVSRTLLHLVLDNLKFSEHPWWFAVDPVQALANKPKIDIIGKRYLYFAISLLIIIPGLAALIGWGFPLAIDYTGGSMLEVSFPAGKTPEPAQVIALYDRLGIPGSQVQSSSNNTVIIRSKDINEETKNQVIAELEKEFGGPVTVQRFDTVGPSVGKEVGTYAAWAVIAAAVGITLYLTFAFRGVPHAFRYGIAAILAMFHDAAVLIGLAAIFGKVFGWEVDSLFLTALLTVIGFSVHDTIVVFDRIRENSNIYRGLPFMTIVNHSTVQTMDRSINTSWTVLITLLSLALLGGVTIRHFVVILLIGVFSGTYSSIFNAACVLVVWEYREWRNWFRRSPGTPDTAVN